MDGTLEIKGKYYRLTKHALHRANRRKITLEEIIETIANPRRVVLIDADKKNGESRYLYQGRGLISAVLNLDKNTIITLIRRNKEYTKSKNKNRRNDKKRKLKLKKAFGNRAKS